MENKMKFILKRKVVRYETVKIEAGSFEEAVQQLNIYNDAFHRDNEIIEGTGTVEYTGE
jgi:hypothetical protein